MTAPTCENPAEAVIADLARLRDVTLALRDSQDQTRSMAVERRELVAALRRRGVPLRELGAAMGIRGTNVWRIAPDAHTADRQEKAS